jgi:hypothetical protein
VRTVVSMLFALTAAGTYAVAAVIQQRAARTTDRSDSMRLRLLVRLARDRAWVMAAMLEVGSYAFQATALYFGPLVLVAPIAGLDLLFALPLIARSRRVALSWENWAGAGCVAGGVAIFLAISPPSAGIATPPFAAWLPLFVTVGVVLVIGVVATRRSSGRIRAGTLAAVGALEFGVLAALSKSVVDQIGRSGWQLLLEWQPYALAVVGVLGMLLAQSAYQAGSLAVSLPIIDTVEPISSVLIGALLFEEKLASDPALLSAQLLGAAVAIAGIVIVDRSPLARDPLEPAPGPSHTP